MFKTLIPATALTLALPAFAFAQAQYSAEEIESHFKAAPELQCPAGLDCVAKPRDRGVCVGTKSECEGSPQTARVEPTGFDLLITFELGSDRLSGQAQQNLAEFARALQGDALRQVEFNVDGHTDASGSDIFNQSLSERRAASVVRFLEGLGVDSARLRAKGHGETAPRENTDPFAPINRRVEATIRTQ